MNDPITGLSFADTQALKYGIAVLALVVCALVGGAMWLRGVVERRAAKRLDDIERGLR